MMSIILHIILCCFFINTLSKEITIPPYFGVDFHTSMEITNLYNRRVASKNKTWQKIIQRYNKYIIQDLSILDFHRIPTIIHQIWLGSPLPQRCKILQKTWLAHHEDWTYFLWTDTIPQAFTENVAVLTPQSLQDIVKFLNIMPLQGGVFIIDIRNLDFSTRGHFTARNNFGEKSDILRYEILFHIGGLYVDTDFECLQPFDVFNYACDFYAGVHCDVNHFGIYNSLIASPAMHPILNDCINAIRIQEQSQSTYTGEDVMKRTGPHLLTHQILKHFDTSQDRTVIFPLTYFYPWPNIFRDEKTREQIEKWIRPESYGIHHWHVSWLTN